MTTEGGQTSLAAYVTSEPPTGVSELTPVGTASGDGELTIDLDEAGVGALRHRLADPAAARSSDGFRGTISEVQVLG